MSAQAMPVPEPMPAQSCRCGQAHEPRHCTAHSKRTGLPCTQRAGCRTDHEGVGLCWLHGGRTVNGEKHAAELVRQMHLRVVAMGDSALDHIAEAMEDPDVPPMVRLRAAIDLADRAGLMPKMLHEHSGPDGGPVPIEVVQAELLARWQALGPGAVIDATVGGPEAAGS